VGLLDCLPETIPAGRSLTLSHRNSIGLYMGSEIQATFSLRTFHNAHTAGVGQQVADYAL
jgi:hypothetical protein